MSLILGIQILTLYMINGEKACGLTIHFYPNELLRGLFHGYGYGICLFLYCFEQN